MSSDNNFSDEDTMNQIKYCNESIRRLSLSPSKFAHFNSDTQTPTADLSLDYQSSHVEYKTGKYTFFPSRSVSTTILDQTQCTEDNEQSVIDSVQNNQDLLPEGSDNPYTCFEYGETHMSSRAVNEVEEELSFMINQMSLNGKSDEFMSYIY